MFTVETHCVRLYSRYFNFYILFLKIKITTILRYIKNKDNKFDYNFSLINYPRNVLTIQWINKLILESGNVHCDG